MGFLDKIKSLLSQNPDKASDAVDKAGNFVNGKTEGRYTDTVDKAQEAAKKNLPRDDEDGNQN